MAHTGMFFNFMLFCCIFFTSYGRKNDEFFEELYIKPLESGHVYFHFQFTTRWNISVHNCENFQHYRLFPKSLGDALTTYQVQELHLTQTQGIWRHQMWGYPIEDASPGAELWVWFKPTVTDVDKMWANLVNAVSGLFCTSLNFLDMKSTVAPHWSFRPRGTVPKGFSDSAKFIRYGTLPGEIVCTENLTPWKKLLPCDSKAGLSTLFKAEHLYDANYHSLAVHFRPVCADKACLSEAVELTQSLALVVDTSLGIDRYQSWTLRKVFGQSLTTQCPLASSSKIFIDTSLNLEKEQFTLSPPPSEMKTFLRGGSTIQFAVYNVGEHTSMAKSLHIAADYANEVKYGSSTLPPLYAHRYITGYGLETGGVSCQIYNTLNAELPVLYMDILPWFTRVFFKSLEVENQGRKVPYKVHYVPGRDRERSYHLELSFTLAPLSVTKVHFQFERAFLKWTEYPPDANHGFYISSAVISSLLPVASHISTPPSSSSTLEEIMSDNSSQFFLRLHTEALLVSLPTPDFSMPYNVICLACTVVAIAFGSVHNLTTRHCVLLDPSKKKGILVRLKEFLRWREKEKLDQLKTEIDNQGQMDENPNQVDDIDNETES